MRQRVSAALAAIVGAVAVAGCHAENQLEPAQSAESVAGLEDAIVGADSNVRVTAQPDAWPGEARIVEEVTPLRVIIENQSDRDVAVRYEHFELIAADGSRYRAMPPLRIEGEAPVEEPLVEANNFEVAPYYSYAYPGYMTFDGPFYDASDYYGTYYDWDIELPTQEMRARAIPEGVLNAGGRIDGFLYFQKVQEDDDSMVTFQAALPAAQEAAQTPQEGRAARPFAVITLPFEVDD